MKITTQAELNSVNIRIKCISILMECYGVDDLEIIELQAELEICLKALKVAYIYTRKRELGLRLLTHNSK